MPFSVFYLQKKQREDEERKKQEMEVLQALQGQVSIRPNNMNRDRSVLLSTQLS